MRVGGRSRHPKQVLPLLIGIPVIKIVCRLHSHADQDDCAECVARLTQALELVRGDFLQEFSLGDCEQFDDWLLIQREQFRLQVTSGLEQLAAFHERAGQLAEAERAIRRLLEYDPLSESAYRQLMRVLARADQRSSALDAYETCRRVLATELGGKDIMDLGGKQNCRDGNEGNSKELRLQMRQPRHDGPPLLWLLELDARLPKYSPAQIIRYIA